MLMARITQTGHQQETLLLSPIYLRSKLSAQLSQSKYSPDYNVFLGVQSLEIISHL